MRDRLLLQAPAKLNLALSVGGPDADGMHPIAGWIVTEDLHDDLELVKLPTGTPSRYAVIWHDEARRRSEIDWSMSKDLAARAHQAVERAVGRSLSIQGRVEKRIPVGGGLGGGSADAAAMLHGVNRLFDLGLSVDDLATIAEPLGSDVPFLVHGGSAIVGGLGERIEHTTPPESLHAVLVFPEVSCLTGPVYRRFDEMRPDARVDEDRVREIATTPIQPDRPFNDLADIAGDLHPSLAELRSSLGEAIGGPMHVSGSGSTLFTLVGDEVTAELVAESIETRFEVPAIPVRPSEGVVAGEVVRGEGD